MNSSLLGSQHHHSGKQGMQQKQQQQQQKQQQKATSTTTSKSNNNSNNNNKNNTKIFDQQIIDIGKPGFNKSSRGGNNNDQDSVIRGSVSWNCTGSWLAWSSNDRHGKIWSIEGGSPREVVVISGHTAALDLVRFHPSDPNLVLSTAQDRTVRLWDLRGGSQHSMGRIELQCPTRYGNCPVSVEWDNKNTNNIVVVERDDRIHIYDSRKISSRNTTNNTNNDTNNSNNAALKTIDLKPNIVEGCQISPNANYLLATTTPRGEGGMGQLRILPYDQKGNNNNNNNNKDDEATTAAIYPGHIGPIYRFCFSPDGTLLATGGADAIVGLWDTEFMVCTQTITRRNKFVRSVAFSNDSNLLANSTEEDGVDIANSRTGEYLGTLYLQATNQLGGADEISFHPKNTTVLACVRGAGCCYTDPPPGSLRVPPPVSKRLPPPVAVVKWNMV